MTIVYHFTSLEDWRKIREEGLVPQPIVGPAQGAGGAAARVLKKLGYTWTIRGRSWGWLLS